eukprot:gene1597-12722_t
MDKFHVVQKYTFTKYDRIIYISPEEIKILTHSFELKETISWSHIKQIIISEDKVGDFVIETTKEKKYFTCHNEENRLELLSCLHKSYNVNSLSFSVVKRTKREKKKNISLQVYSSFLNFQNESNFENKSIYFFLIEKIIEYSNGIYIQIKNNFKEYFFEMSEEEDRKKFLKTVFEKSKENLNLKLNFERRNKEEFTDYPYKVLQKIKKFYFEIPILKKNEKRNLILNEDGLYEVLEKNNLILNFHPFNEFMNLIKKKDKNLVFQYFNDKNYEYQFESEILLDEIISNFFEIFERKKLLISITSFELKKSLIILNSNSNSLLLEISKLIQLEKNQKEKKKFKLYFIHLFYIKNYSDYSNFKDKKLIHYLLKEELNQSENKEILFQCLFKLLRYKDSFEEFFNLKFKNLLQSWILKDEKSQESMEEEHYNVINKVKENDTVEPSLDSIKIPKSDENGMDQSQYTKESFLKFLSCQTLRYSIEQLFENNNDKLEYQIKSFYFSENNLKMIFQVLKEKDIKKDILFFYSIFNILQILIESNSTDIEIKKEIFELVKLNIQYLFFIQNETISLGIQTNLQILIKRTISYFSNISKIQEISFENCFFISQIYKLFTIEDEFLFSQISDTIGYLVLKNENLQKLFKKIIPYPLFKIKLKNPSLSSESFRKGRYYPIKKQNYQQTLKFKKLTTNWYSFFKNSMEGTFIQSNLIWNQNVKNELSHILFKEIQNFKNQKMDNNNIIWNGEDFKIQLNCLNDEIKVGDIYITTLLKLYNSEGIGGFEENIENIQLFSEDLHHEMMFNSDINVKISCLKTNSTIHAFHRHEFLGYFPFIDHLCFLLNKTKEKRVLVEILNFISQLLVKEENCKIFIKFNGIQTILNLLPDIYLNDQDEDNIKITQICLRILLSLSTFHSSIDEEYRILFPLPKSKEIMCDIQSNIDIHDEVEFEDYTLDQNYSNNEIVNHEMSNQNESITNDNISDSLNELKKQRIKNLEIIIQLLILSNQHISGITISLIQQIIKFNKEEEIISNLFESGLFYFLFISNAPLEDIIQLIKDLHLKQKNKDILNNFLTNEIIFNFSRLSVQELTFIFKTEMLISNPFLIFNENMLKLIKHHLNDYLYDFKQKLRDNKFESFKTYYQNKKFKKLNFKILKNEIVANNIYLRNFININTWNNNEYEKNIFKIFKIENVDEFFISLSKLFELQFETTNQIETDTLTYYDEDIDHLDEKDLEKNEIFSILIQSKLTLLIQSSISKFDFSKYKSIEHLLILLKENKEKDFILTYQILCLINLFTNSKSLIKEFLQRKLHSNIIEIINFSIKNLKIENLKEEKEENRFDLIEKEENKTKSQIIKEMIRDEEYESKKDTFYQTHLILLNESNGQDDESESKSEILSKEKLKNFNFNLTNLNQDEKLFKILIESLDVFNNVLYKSNNFKFLKSNDETNFIGLILNTIKVVKEKKEISLILNSIHLLNKNFNLKFKMNRTQILIFVLLNIFQKKELEFSFLILRELIGFKDTLENNDQVLIDDEEEVDNPPMKNESKEPIEKKGDTIGQKKVSKYDDEIFFHLKLIFPENILKFIENNSFKHLFEDIETPTLIWNESSRQDLVSYFSNENLNYKNFKEFNFKSQENEIKVNEIYLRLWNKNTKFKIENPNEFLKQILILLEKEKNEENLEILFDSILKILQNFINISSNLKPFISLILSFFNKKSNLKILNFLFEILFILVQQEEDQDDDSFKNLFLKFGLFDKLKEFFNVEEEEREMKFKNEIKSNCLNLLYYFKLNISNELMKSILKTFVDENEKEENLKKSSILVANFSDDILKKLFPRMFLIILKKNPVETRLKFFENDYNFPELIWNYKFKNLLKKSTQDDEFNEIKYEFPSCEIENIFLENFIGHSNYPIENEDEFLKGLFKNLHQSKYQNEILKSLFILSCGDITKIDSSSINLNKKSTIFISEYLSLLLPLLEGDCSNEIFCLIKNISLLKETRKKLIENDQFLDYFENYLKKKDNENIIEFINILIRLIIDNFEHYSKLILNHSLFDYLISILSDSNKINSIRDKVSDLFKRIVKERNSIGKIDRDIFTIWIEPKIITPDDVIFEIPNESIKYKGDIFKFMGFQSDIQEWEVKMIFEKMIDLTLLQKEEEEKEIERRRKEIEEYEREQKLKEIIENKPIESSNDQSIISPTHTNVDMVEPSIENEKWGVEQDLPIEQPIVISNTNPIQPTTTGFETDIVDDNDSKWNIESEPKPISTFDSTGNPAIDHSISDGENVLISDQIDNSKWDSEPKSAFDLDDDEDSKWNTEPVVDVQPTSTFNDDPISTFNEPIQPVSTFDDHDSKWKTGDTSDLDKWNIGNNDPIVPPRIVEEDEVDLGSVSINDFSSILQDDTPLSTSTPKSEIDWDNL